MKLNDNFILVSLENEVNLIPTEEAANSFHGVIQGNETALFIISCLQEETTKEDIVNRMLDVYNTSEAEAIKNIDKVLIALKKVGALVE